MWWRTAAGRGKAGHVSQPWQKPLHSWEPACLALAHHPAVSFLQARSARRHPSQLDAALRCKLAAAGLFCALVGRHGSRLLSKQLFSPLCSMLLLPVLDAAGGASEDQLSSTAATCWIFTRGTRCLQTAGVVRACPAARSAAAVSALSASLCPVPNQPFVTQALVAWVRRVWGYIVMEYSSGGGNNAQGQDELEQVGEGGGQAAGSGWQDHRHAAACLLAMKPACAAEGPAMQCRALAAAHMIRL